MVDFFNIKFSDIAKTSNLLLTTRIREYWQNSSNSSNVQSLSFYLDNDNKYSLGQIKSDEYFEKSEKYEIPVIDQSVQYIAGYTDQEDLIYTGKLPVVIFGDHTRNFKYVDFPFVQGADGIKILKPNEDLINPKFFFYLLDYFSVPSRGYNRHFSVLAKQKYPLIDKTEQEIFVNKAEKIENEIEILKKTIKRTIDIINIIFADEFNYKPELWKQYGKGMTAGTQYSDEPKFYSYSFNLQDLTNSKIFRFSARFHNPIVKELSKLLKSYNLITLKKIITEPVHRGVQPKPDEKGTVYAIKTGQLKNDYIELSDAELVTEEYANTNPRATVKQGDILLASTGKVSLGKIDLYEYEENGLADGHISIIRIDETKFNKQFVVYYFRSLLGMFQIERDFTGATNQIELYANEIENFVLPDISLSRQEKIVKKIKTQLDKQKIQQQQIIEKQNEIKQLIKELVNN